MLEIKIRVRYNTAPAHNLDAFAEKGLKEIISVAKCYNKYSQVQ